MKVDWNAKTGLPKIIFDDADLSDMAHVEEMFKGTIPCQHCGKLSKHDGWKVFQGFLDSEKLKLYDKIESSIAPFRVAGITEESTKVQVANIVAFKHFMDLPNEIIRQMGKLVKDRQEEEDLKNEARHDDQY